MIEISKRSAEHSRALRAVKLSREGARCRDALIAGVQRLLERVQQIACERGEEAALDVFYAELVDVYRDSGWDNIGMLDRLRMSSTASWQDLRSVRAVRAAVAISLL